MARPSTYDFSLCEEICDKIASGANVVDVLNSDDSYPTWPTFRRWKQDNDELFTLYIKSIQDKAEHVDFEIDKSLKDLKNGKLTPSEANVIIQTLKWKAAKYYPKMYGDKQVLDLQSKGESIKQKTDLSKLSEDDLRLYAELQSKLEGHTD